jgi:signal transduction histidine kinase
LNETRSSLDFASRCYGHRAISIAAALLASVLIVIEATTVIELNIPILFGLPLILAGLSGNKRLLWLLTAAFMATTFIAYVVQRPPGPFGSEPYFVNRTMAEVAILATAIIVTMLMDALRVLKMRGEAAEAASTRKTRLLTSVSHDLRTPLTTINVIAQLIQRTTDKPDVQQQLNSLAEDLGRNVMSASELLADALDISALESGHSVLHETEFSLNDLLVEECQRVKPLADAKGLSVTATRIEPDVRVVADRMKLVRIIGNLVNNAIKFTDSGVVHISAEAASGQSLFIHVADTGIGIAPEDLGRIFEEFVQGRDSGPKRMGWGLGLSISRRLTELMGGTITVRSEMAKGSLFTVQLPSNRVVLGQ